MAQIEDDDEDEVEIHPLVSLRKHLAFIILITVVCTVVAGVVAYMLPDEYTAQTTMYVLTRNDDSNRSTTTTQSDLSAGQMLSSDVATLITSERVTSDVATQLGLEDLDDYDIDVNNSTDTRVITLSVTGEDPQGAADVANAIVTDVSNVASEVMQVESVNVIDQAKVPDKPSGPNRTMYVLIGLVGGFVVSYVISLLRDMMDGRITSDDEIEQLIDIPVVGHFQELKG